MTPRTEAETRERAAAHRAWRSVNPLTAAQKSAARITTNAWRASRTPEQKQAMREYQRVWRAAARNSIAMRGQS